MTSLHLCSLKQSLNGQFVGSYTEYLSEAAQAALSKGLGPILIWLLFDLIDLTLYAINLWTFYCILFVYCFL